MLSLLNLRLPRLHVALLEPMWGRRTSLQDFYQEMGQKHRLRRFESKILLQDASRFGLARVVPRQGVVVFKERPSLLKDLR